MMKIKKVIALLSVLAIIIISCSKGEEKIPNDQNDKLVLELANTEYSGCFTNNLSDINRNLISVTDDSLYYTIENDTLILHVILEYNCCGLLKDSLTNNGQDVFIYIRDTSLTQCYCLCDFGFEYSFINFIGNNIHFYVYLKAFYNDEYTLWKDLEYNGKSSKALLTKYPIKKAESFFY